MRSRWLPLGAIAIVLAGVAWAGLRAVSSTSAEGDLARSLDRIEALAPPGGRQAFLEEMVRRTGGGGAPVTTAMRINGVPVHFEIRHLEGDAGRLLRDASDRWKALGWSVKERWFSWGATIFGIDRIRREAWTMMLMPAGSGRVLCVESKAPLRTTRRERAVRDLPPVPGGKPALHVESDEGAGPSDTFMAMLPEPMSRVKAYYQARMPGEGWKAVRTADPGREDRSAVLFFEKGARECALGLSDVRGRATLVSLHVYPRRGT